MSRASDRPKTGEVPNQSELPGVRGTFNRRMVVMKGTWIILAGLLTSGACGNNGSSSVSTTTTTAPEATSTQPAHEITQDSTYVEAVTDQAESKKLDVYAPTRAGSHPVVVLLHGSGATKNHADVVTVSRQLAEAGLVVFVPTHAATGAESGLTAAAGRRMRESFEDTLCAIRYASQHAVDHSGDPARVFVIGQSASNAGQRG